MRLHRTQVLKVFVELGYSDVNGIGLWDWTKESVQVFSEEEATKIVKEWLEAAEKG